MKQKSTATVVSQKQLAAGIYSLILKCPQAADAKCGQFISLYCKAKEHLLPRPISICEIDKNESTLRLVYRVAGDGTKEFSELAAGDTIEVLGPLGNGFESFLNEGKAPMVVGGGIGVPPMLQLAKDLSVSPMAVMGYRNDDTFLTEEFTDAADLYIATDDGSIGTHGTVVDAIKENELKPDVIYACGPKPMLKALKSFADSEGIKLYISMEERMACGIGACLACVCQSMEVDDHSKVNNKRVCVDGPVFEASEVEL